jgi:anti-sigma factor RsiW
MKASTRTARCRSFLENLSLYIDDELSGPARRTVTLHLRRCPCCHELADSLRRTVLLCRQSGGRPLPAAVRARAQARIAALLAEQPSSSARR